MSSNFVRYKADKAEIIVVDALKYGSNENNLKDFDMALRITDYASPITHHALPITQMRNFIV